jgi:hypothetical protein
VAHSTHFVDYGLWANGDSRARWVAGHVQGRERLDDSHPSPSYAMGQICFDNGVRAFVEFENSSTAHMPADSFWLDNRLTVYGSRGYVWADTDGHWGAFTKGRRTIPSLVRAKGGATRSRTCCNRSLLETWQIGSMVRGLIPVT